MIGLRSPQQTKTVSVCYGESGDISRPNDDAVIGQCDLIVERERAYRLVFGAPRVNQDLSVCYGEKRRYELLFNDRAERYHSCNLVTEREPRQMSEVDKRSRRSQVDYWTCGALLRGFEKIAEEQLRCRESFNRRGVCSLGIRIYALVRYKVLAKILCCFICVYKIYCVFLHSFM